MQVSARKIAILSILLLLSGTGFCLLTTVSAQYYPISQNTLTVVMNYPGAGYVYPGNGTYNYGSTVTPQVSTYTGYVFDGWYLNGIYMGKLTSIPITMIQDNLLVATFSIRTTCLTITNNPSQGGTTSPAAGIWNYSSGSTITVRETPSAGGNFSGWYLDGIYEGAGTSITLSMNQDHQLGAFFAGTFPTPSPSPAPQPNSTITPTPTPTPGLPIPSLSFYCASSTVTSGFRVTIDGALSYNGIGISGTGVIFYYSADGGASWNNLAYLITGNSGNFSAVWMPSASGNYIVKGIWQSDGTYSSVVTQVNFAVTPTQSQNTFSVSSNSTLSSLVFDSTQNTLSFTVSGASGTYGYVQACIPKTIEPVIANLQVALDGSPVTYVTYDQGDVWIITIEYHHSSHSVVMALNGATPTPTPTSTASATTNPTQTFNPTATATSTTATASPSPAPTPTPTVPELTVIIAIPLLVAMVSAALYVKQKQKTHSAP
jgi:hypothetical protein